MAEHSAYVLAGGLSTRMGQDKASLLLHGRTLLDRALETLTTVGAPATVLPDIHPHCGPLSGIEAALTATTHDYNLFLPVDLPLLPAPFLRWMLSRALNTGALVTIPRIQGRPQPLCAVYHRELLPSITAALEAGNYKVMMVLTAAADRMDLFDTERVASTNPAFSTFSPHPLHRWFFNCNTPSDLTLIKMLYS